MKNNIHQGIRKIARLDLKNTSLIKGISLEGYKIIGCPIDYAIKYYKQGIDELILVDNIATLFNTKLSLQTIKNISKKVFIPITVGGGLKNLKEVDECFKAGADRVTINSALFENINLINQVADKYGSQAIQASIQAKYVANNKWEAFYAAGREESGKCVIEYAKELEKCGAGEILVTSVDNDGTMKGMDKNLIKSLARKVSIPVIICGGYKSKNDFKLANYYEYSGIAIASALHYKKSKITDLGN